MPTGAAGTENLYRNAILAVDGVSKELNNATASAGAATATGLAGKITSEALTTAQNAIYTLTLTNTAIAAADLVFASVGNGTNTQGTPVVTSVTPAAGSVVIKISNLHASAESLNGTIKISYFVVRSL